MKKIILTFILVLGGIVTASGQNARDLFMTYSPASTVVSAPTNNTANETTVPKNGMPGTKVIIERSRDGKLSFEKPTSKFKSGDKIRLRFATNFNGYIRILNIGSSGKVSLLFPYEGANERISASSDFQIPNNNDWIVFDNTPGTETLSVIMSGMPFGTDSDLAGLSTRATAGGRDLKIESNDDATFVVFPVATMIVPIGFTLILKHK